MLFPHLSVPASRKPAFRLLTLLSLAFVVCLLALPVSLRAQSIRGAWTGPWENSLGQSGQSSLTIDEDGDRVSGTWGDDRFQGHRRGNEVNFRIVGGLHGCTDYEGHIVFYGGDAGRLTYEANNHCNEPHHYSGWQRLRRIDESEREGFSGGIRGVWIGHWENSLGDQGDGRWEVNEENNGIVRGIWDGDPFEGHRNGNSVFFRVHRGQGGCINYEVTVTIFGHDKAARLVYEADNRCNHTRYSGSERLHVVN